MFSFLDIKLKYIFEKTNNVVVVVVVEDSDNN